MSDFRAKITEREQELREVARRAVAQALGAGADEAEVYVGGVTGLNVSARDQDVENIEFNRDRGMDITVYRARRRGTASTNDLSPDAVAECIKSAVAIASYADADPDAGLCEKELQCTEFPDLQVLFEPDGEPEAAVERALALERLYKEGEHPWLRQSDGVSFSANVYTGALANSQDFCAARSSSYFYKGITLVGQRDGHMERGSGYSAARDLRDLYADERIFAEALANTLNRLDRRPLPTGEYTVIFTRNAVQSLWQNLIAALSGGALYRRSSFLCDKLGQRILPDYVSIYEDPTLKKSFGSASYDNEGVAVRPLAIARGGVLLEYLLATYSARKLGLRSNGHAGGIYNWFVDFGGHTLNFDELLGTVGEGLVIDSLMGQGVNLVTGNYSRGASGYYFRGGRRVHAVSEITIAGNLRDMFGSLAWMGSDSDPRHKIRSGSLAVPRMTVSGQ